MSSHALGLTRTSDTVTGNNSSNNHHRGVVNGCGHPQRAVSGDTVQYTTSTHNAYTSSIPARTSAERPSSSRQLMPFDASSPMTATEFELQFQVWQERLARSQIDSTTTPRLTQLFQHLTSRNGSMVLTDQSTSQSLKSNFWSTVCRLPAEQQQAIFKELRQGKDEALYDAGNLHRRNMSAQHLPTSDRRGIGMSSPVSNRPQATFADSPTIIAPRPPPTAAAARGAETARQPSASTALMKADQSVFGDLIPTDFVAHPRFVPFQVAEYSKRYTNSCRPFLQKSSSSVASNQNVDQDPMIIFKKPIDTRSAEELLQPFASGVGRLIGGLVGADLLDRESSAFVQAIKSLQTRQEMAEARAAKAEDRVALLERQIFALQGLLKSSNLVGTSEVSPAHTNTALPGNDKIFEQVRILYQHQKMLEAKIKDMEKDSNVKDVDIVQSAPPQVDHVDVALQQVDVHQQQLEGQNGKQGDDSIRSDSATRVAEEDIRESVPSKINRRGLLEMIASQQEKPNEEMMSSLDEQTTTEKEVLEGTATEDVAKGESETIQTTTAGEARILPAVKAEDEPDELMSDREETLATSQSPPPPNPTPGDKDNRWYRRFGLDRVDEEKAASTPALNTLKRKRPVHETSFIVIDSSDDEQ